MFGPRLFCTPLFELSRIESAPGDTRRIAKRLVDAYRDDKVQQRLFETDQAFLAGIDHAGMMRYHRLGGHDSDPVHVMQVPTVRSLRQFLNDCERAAISTPMHIATGLALELCDLVRAVECVQRLEDASPPWVDLNPDTLFVDDTGRILAAHVSLQDPPSVKTAVFSREGFPFLVYAAPEQCVRGRDPSHLASRFTLGMVIFEVMTGRRLFSRISQNDVEQLNRRKVRCVHPTPSDVDKRLEPLDDVVRRLLDPIPEQRLSDIHDIVERIGNAMNVASAETTSERVNFIAEVDSQLAKITDKGGGGDGLPTPKVSDITELNAS